MTVSIEAQHFVHWQASAIAVKKETKWKITQRFRKLLEIEIRIKIKMRTKHFLVGMNSQVVVPTLLVTSRYDTGMPVLRRYDATTQAKQQHSNNNNTSGADSVHFVQSVADEWLP